MAVRGREIYMCHRKPRTGHIPDWKTNEPQRMSRYIYDFILSNNFRMLKIWTCGGMNQVGTGCPYGASAGMPVPGWYRQSMGMFIACTEPLLVCTGPCCRYGHVYWERANTVNSHFTTVKHGLSLLHFLFPENRPRLANLAMNV